MDNWRDPAFAPFVKCMIVREGAFIANTFTNKYDLGRKDYWQELSVSFYPREQDNLMNLFSFEKGTADKVITGDVSLDGMKVELE